MTASNPGGGVETDNRPVLGMVLKGYPRISETFISNEILQLEELGFRLHIFSMRHPREAFCHDSVKRIKAKVDYLPSTIMGNLRPLLYHNVLLAAKKPRLYFKAALKAARRFLRTRKSATLKHLLQAGYLVHLLLPGRNITHLHAHFAHSPTSVAMFASMLSGLPFSFTGHAKDIYTSDPRQLAEKMHLAQFVITCTEYNRRHLVELSGGNHTPVHCVYHGIDLNLFNYRQPIQPEPPYRLFTVARLTPKKGLSTVLQAVRLLKDRGLDVRHVLIGDGEDRDSVLAQIKSLGLENVTQWLGTRPHGVVLQEFSRADVFVLGCEVASNGDRDGIPNVFAESMAVGVPVVGTRVSAIPELVIHNQTGLLVEPGDPEATADAVQRLLTDPDTRATVIEGARRHVIAVFDNRKLIRDVAALYSEAGL
jgi:glycosyltransferase involved in cell wall biosynthesis